jgi:molecular chaperone DnaJ
LTAEEKAAPEKLGHSPNFKPHPDKSDKSFLEKMREMFS